jgi:hypothetical protein
VAVCFRHDERGRQRRHPKLCWKVCLVQELGSWWGAAVRSMEVMRRCPGFNHEAVRDDLLDLSSRYTGIPNHTNYRTSSRWFAYQLHLVRAQQCASCKSVP